MKFSEAVSLIQEVRDRPQMPAKFARAQEARTRRPGEVTEADVQRAQAGLFGAARREEAGAGSDRPMTRAEAEEVVNRIREAAQNGPTAEEALDAKLTQLFNRPDSARTTRLGEA